MHVSFLHQNRGSRYSTIVIEMHGVAAILEEN